jgi:predicted HicB family RNase H-like nuclease
MATRLNKAPRSAQLVLRVEPELRERIEMAASAERRPLASLVRNILSDWVDGRTSYGERAGA